MLDSITKDHVRTVPFIFGEDIRHYDHSNGREDLVAAADDPEQS